MLQLPPTVPKALSFIHSFDEKTETVTLPNYWSSTHTIVRNAAISIYYGIGCSFIFILSLPLLPKIKYKPNFCSCFTPRRILRTKHITTRGNQCRMGYFYCAYHQSFALRDVLKTCNDLFLLQNSL